jgi:aryl-alcohol dehydrogenase-like predicted oxidoreductase
MMGLSHLRPVTVQNAYNLLERNDFESGMLEACSPRNGNMGLLAYSPLAGGALTGKYLNLAGGGSAPETREARPLDFILCYSPRKYIHAYVDLGF